MSSPDKIFPGNIFAKNGICIRIHWGEPGWIYFEKYREGGRHLQSLECPSTVPGHMGRCRMEEAEFMRQITDCRLLDSSATH